MTNDPLSPVSVSDERRAPVQGYAAGIPWSLHLEAYDAYCKRYGKQQALIEGWCRGGFGTGELDEYIPGWRDKVSEIGRLQSRSRESARRSIPSEYPRPKLARRWFNRASSGGGGANSQHLHSD